jgi:hypothetical protein
VRFSSRSITCPRCSMTSYNPNDVQNLYCGYCCWWTSDALLAGAMLDGVHRLSCNRPQCIGCEINPAYFSPS